MALKVKLIGWFRIAISGGGPETTVGLRYTAMVYGPAVVPPASFDEPTMNVEVPGLVAVPEIVPPELRVSPSGRDPVTMVNVGAGAPVAVRSERVRLADQDRWCWGT